MACTTLTAVLVWSNTYHDKDKSYKEGSKERSMRVGQKVVVYCDISKRVIYTNLGHILTSNLW